MYAFDALTGGQLWFRGLQQYDQWTPAIGGDYAYAYVGEYTPGSTPSPHRTGSRRS